MKALNHVIPRVQRIHNLLFIGAVLACVLATFQVNAASVASDTAFARFMSTTVGAGQETVSFSSSGTPILTPSPATISTSGGSINVSRTGSLGLPGGAKLPITATAKIPGSAAARIIKNALPLVGAAAAGPLAVALTSVAIEVGYNLAFPNATTVTVEAPRSGVQCASGLCKQWGDGIAPQAYFTDIVSTCQSFTSKATASSSSYSYIYTRADAPSNTCFYYLKAKSGTYTSSETSTTRNYVWIDDSPSIPKTEPATQQQFADAIANKVGWPDSSAIAEALNQSQRATGEVIPTEGPKVSGPATVQGPAEVTTKPIPNGTRETTTQTEYNCTYIDGASVMDGGTVACSEKVTTTDKDTVTNPSTGQTSTTTTQTSQTTKPADTTAQKPQEVADPCDKNPDRVGCATLDTPTADIPKVNREVSYAAETLFGGGSCPADKVVHLHTGQNLTAWNWTQACGQITTYFRPVLLAVCAFIAMVILIPKGEV